VTLALPKGKKNKQKNKQKTTNNKSYNYNEGLASFNYNIFNEVVLPADLFRELYNRF
jgi:hypothetical protein